MPPPNKQPQQKGAVVASSSVLFGHYPAEAFEFVQQGLSFTVQKVHGPGKKPKASRHVSGQQLCEGLRELALRNWGFLAAAVLRRWNVTRTLDFGRIVFTMIEHGHMQKRPEDTLDDFKDVYEFAAAFERGYRIPLSA